MKEFSDEVLSIDDRMDRSKPEPSLGLNLARFADAGVADCEDGLEKGTIDTALRSLAVDKPLLLASLVGVA